jgi:hypothetical protein
MPLPSATRVKQIPSVHAAFAATDIVVKTLRCVQVYQVVSNNQAKLHLDACNVFLCDSRTARRCCASTCGERVHNNRNVHKSLLGRVSERVVGLLRHKVKPNLVPRRVSAEVRPPQSKHAQKQAR